MSHGDRVGNTGRIAEAEIAIERLRGEQALLNLVGRSPSFLEVIERVCAVAKVDASVMVEGETGTGKELVARAIHYLGKRADQPFVPINCGSLPDSLLEDELFGHERGAFTDARTRRVGLIAQADGGTLFLDEVDSLSPRAQVALLRVLQDRAVRSLGAERERKVNVRFIAATNASLSALVRTGNFRSDLYYRMCVLGIAMPPLRERGSDVILLARYFLERYATPRHLVELSPSAELSLQAYLWPGNVRELENVIQRAVALTPQSRLEPEDLGLAAPTATNVVPSLPSLDDEPDVLNMTYRDAKRAIVAAFERQYLTRLMQSHRGNVTRAAVSAGKERRDLGRLLKKHRLDPRAFAY
jgi:DNA-binding NtrC family response regulator